ncbi:hypothetical protein P8C59_007813 [Phyllachora maydis]|uniref:Uncharacterized protein n=1 Tax=Phyllachora maydis TaxID=1825666 RepID=A0AAD9MEK2_9PEZI|nr:hypothetical protein P8C59_007813 [Phyllachora maydis]
MEIKLYQSLVGTAMYIMLLTRVDISFTVQWLSRSLNRPTKSHLNAAKNLFKYLNSTKDYSICFSYNGNTVADLGPKLSNSSNITTKLSRDFHSKEGPRPLTTTSITIVDSRNSKGSSRTSIINSSLVPIGFSDSDFVGDKATSKSTYGYLYKLAEAIREVQWIIGLFSELYRPIDYPITLYGDNQGSITVANDPALYARTKHTLLKFRYVREQVKAKIVTIIYLNTKSACKAKQCKSAKACATAAKKEDLRRSKRTTGSNAGRYTTDSSLIADKDDNNAYNRAYMPPTEAEEEEEKDSSSNDDSVNSSTSNSADKGKGSSVCKHGKGASRYKDTLLYKQQRVISYPYSPPSAPCANIYVYYVQVITASKGRGPNNA